MLTGRAATSPAAGGGRETSTVETEAGCHTTASTVSQRRAGATDCYGSGLSAQVCKKVSTGLWENLICQALGFS